MASQLEQPVTHYAPSFHARLAFPGETQFCVNITDGVVVTAACVNLRVGPPTVTAVDDTYSCAYGLNCSVPATQGLLGNDASSANLTLSIVGAPVPSAGSLAVSTDGSFEWVPPGT